MPSSRHEKTARQSRKRTTELRCYSQLGLDFVVATSYSTQPRKETKLMNQELIEVLEKKINDIVEKYTCLKEENSRLNDEINRLSSDREGIKSRVDAILGKLDGI